MAMMKARDQAQRYARALPKEEIPEGRPPFVLVVDVGNSIALYAEFTRTGGHYVPFPDPNRYRYRYQLRLGENFLHYLQVHQGDQI